MGTTTMGVKLDDATRERIKSAASRIDRTPHWLIKQAIFNYLEKLENDETLPELPALLSGAANESDEAGNPADEPYQPFLDFAEQILPQSVSRASITAAWRWAETDAVPMLLEQSRRTGAQARVSAGGKAAQSENRQRPRRNGAKPAAGVLALLTGGRGADVPGGSAAAHSGQSHPRRPDPRQNQQRQLAVAYRPQPVAVRQRRHLGAAVYRQAGLDP